MGYDSISKRWISNDVKTQFGTEDPVPVGVTPIEPITSNIHSTLSNVFCSDTVQNRGKINHAFSDLNTVIRQNFTVIDATRVFTSCSPKWAGTAEQLNTIVAGVDAAAVPLAK